jgi:tetratricopeptide (TPR) repeat protein
MQPVQGMSKTRSTTDWRFFGTILIVMLAFLAADVEAQNPGFDEVVLKANAARDAGEVATAISLYSQAVQMNPRWPDGWWFLGSLQYGAGSYTTARDALSRFLELTPNAGPATALRGLCEFEIGDFQSAAGDIQRGIALGAANSPKNEQILRYHEGMALTKLGRFEDAIKVYDFFARNAISNPELLLAIGAAGLRMQLLPAEIGQDQQELVVGAGSAAFEFIAGNDATAAQAFQNAFAKFPTAQNLHYLYGFLLFSTDPDVAIREFKEELGVSPANYNAQVMAAWGLLMRGKPAEALPFAQEAVKSQPGVSTAQLVMGRALAETGDLQDGIEHLKRALELEPKNLETHIALAKAYSRSGMKEDARRERLLCLQVTKDEIQVAQP